MHSLERLEFQAKSLAADADAAVNVVNGIRTGTISVGAGAVQIASTLAAASGAMKELGVQIPDDVDRTIQTVSAVSQLFETGAALSAMTSPAGAFTAHGFASTV